MGITFTWPELPPVTVRMVDPKTLPWSGWVIGTVSVMVVVPAETGVALPLLPLVLLMVATAGDDELHVPVAVRF